MQNQLLNISVTEGVFTFNAYDIIRLKASSNYTFIYFTNRKPLVIAKVLKEFENILSDAGFIRIHRTHLINKKYINSISDNNRIIMSDDSVAEISRRMKTLVKKKLASA